MSVLRITSKVFSNIKIFRNNISQALFSTDITEEKPHESLEVKPGGYAKAFEKFENIKDNESEQPQTFASLLKNSRFIDLGDPEGKIVTGKIFHIVDDDLYIDFGWKFNCVCSRPKKDARNISWQLHKRSKSQTTYKRLGTLFRFLGFEKDLTLLEADCALLGLVQERSKDPK
ncbi:hypothetical protein NQ318_002396 [Aromia moschata]|uniref:Mitochondrial ribosomal protein S28 n=1 Tax=Aromia moschata TaxID=1265417 RepID=A0AAV8YE89_9CUCU|nr:hypothetical protein NQ318_002396 [Aromia moschata]